MSERPLKGGEAAWLCDLRCWDLDLGTDQSFQGSFAESVCPGFLWRMNVDCVPMKEGGKNPSVSPVFENNSPCLSLLGTSLGV